MKTVEFAAPAFALLNEEIRASMDDTANKGPLILRSPSRLGAIDTWKSVQHWHPTRCSFNTELSTDLLEHNMRVCKAYF